jgi:uncharacterized protein (TIGR02246 family)
MSRKTLIVSLGIAVVAGGAVLGQRKTDPALDKLTAAFAEAFNAKDAAKVASFYTEDAVLMPPNEARVSGRSNIEAWFKKSIEQGLTNLRLSPTESSTAGGQAFEAGTYTLTVGSGSSQTTGGGGSSVNDKGKYVVVWKRAGSDWKLAYDIFNSDLPPAPAPPK